MDALATVLVFVCVIPVIIFFVGFAFGRWSKGIKISRVGPEGQVADPRYARQDARPPRQDRVLRQHPAPTSSDEGPE